MTSWAVVDYFLRPKPAFFSIKRELSPVTVGLKRREDQTFADADTAAHFTLVQQMEICRCRFLLRQLRQPPPSHSD